MSIPYVSPKKQASRSKKRRDAQANGGTTRRAFRVAVYVRLSLFTVDTTSPARQREICELEVAKRGGVYDPSVDFYEDIDKSGFQENVVRPGYDRMMANIDQYDMIIVYRIDRLTRRVGRFADLLKVTQKASCDIVSATEPIDTSTPAGRAMIQVIMIFAELESETVGERVSSAQDFMVRNGRWRGGARPFGWRPMNSNEEGGIILMLDPFEAPLLRQAISDFLGGTSMRTICIRWNKDGVRTTQREARRAKGEDDPKKGWWHGSTLRQLFLNPVLTGYGVYGQELVRAADGTLLRTAEPLIDEHTFMQLHNKIEGKKSGQKTTNHSVVMMSGIALCGLCTKPMLASPVSYVCRQFKLTKNRECPGTTISRVALDAYVLNWLASYLASVDFSSVPVPPDVDLELLERQRVQANRKLDRLEEDRLEGMYDTPEDRRRFIRMRTEVLDELATLADRAPQETEVQRYLAAAGAIDLDTLLALKEKNLPLLRRIIEETLEVSVAKGHPGKRATAESIKQRVTIRPRGEDEEQREVG